MATSYFTAHPTAIHCGDLVQTIFSLNWPEGSLSLDFELTPTTAQLPLAIF